MLFFTSLQAKEEWSPNYLLIGAQKAGTTALFDYINQHPFVVNKTDEVHFFDTHFTKGKEWYKSKFSKRPDNRYVIGDKSPYYIFHPSVPERVHSYYPGIKIIAILRNPVSRAYSQYWFNRHRNLEELSFKEAINAEPTRLAGEMENILADPEYSGMRYRRKSYLARGRYAEQLERWYALFPKEQIFIVDADDLRNDPQGTLNKVYAFLGLEPHALDLSHNDAHTDYPPMKAGMKKRLQDYFLPYNEALEALLNRKFNW